MDRSSDIPRFVGHDIVDCVGEKLGRVENVYVDEATNKPPWARVEVYALGNQPAFVPLADASPDGDDLRIVYDKRTVVEAPAVQAVDPAGRVSEGERAQLYRYYGLASAEKSPGLEKEPAPFGPPVTFP